MITSLLIANRGEIARRIIRTAHRLGVRTVAVYSDADARAPHVREADAAVRLGPGPATESYLRGDLVIAAAKATGADAIHPGYGFLSENADFAAAVVDAGLIFVGPTADAMRKLGGKASAKEVAIEAGVRVVPGYQGAAQDLATLKREAQRIGYPVMIKAVAGGGGRGMRFVPDPAELEPLLDSAKREAATAFGNDSVLIEKVVIAPRHIEVQVFGDRHGNVVHLFERDCSLQRRNQKVIEEAPAPGMSAMLRRELTDAAIKLADAVGYEGAGTVEFLVEGGRLDAHAPWYFIEMNTRLQVEHPVTEEITGLDLVDWQLRVASGEELPLTQSGIEMRGHAIEARLCAEDPSRGFLPSIGRIELIETAEMAAGRLELGVESGSVVSPYYDSMVAKLIGVGDTREDALDRVRSALGGTLLFGLKTNAAFLARLLEHPDVKAGRADTGLIGRELDALTASEPNARAADFGVRLLLGGAPGKVCHIDVGPGHRLHRHRDEGDTDVAPGPWERYDAFQLGPPRQTPYRVIVDGEPLDVIARWDAKGRLTTSVARGAPSDPHRFAIGYVSGDTAYVLQNLVHTTVAWPTWSLDDLDAGEAGSVVRAPITGKVARMLVAEGDTVEKGQRVAIVEAMKMEHVLVAPRSGRVERITAAEGTQVAQGGVIVALAGEG
jgi:3-methylcrotonyl-CoA carboxylase alpha subunit